MKLHHRILPLVALCAALFCAPRAWADAININFAGSFGDGSSISTNSVYDPGTVPSTMILGNSSTGFVGVDQSFNGYVWNNITGTSGTAIGTGVLTGVNGGTAVGNGNPSGTANQLYSGGTGNAVVTNQNTLYESVGGVATPINTTVTFSAGRTDSNGIADAYYATNHSFSPQSLLLNNYLDGSNASGQASVTLNGLPTSITSHSGGYSLYVYVAGTNLTSSMNPSDYTVTAGVHTGMINAITGEQYNYTHAETPPVVSPAPTYPGNFIVFNIPAGMGSSLTLLSDVGGVNPFSPIDALSISIPTNLTGPGGPGGPGTPEPASMILMALGALGLAGMGIARRRRARKS